MVRAAINKQLSDRRFLVMCLECIKSVGAEVQSRFTTTALSATWLPRPPYDVNVLLWPEQGPQTVFIAGPQLD